MIGGIIPGLIMATLGYYLSEPIIRAYQNRRKGFLLKKLRALKSRSSDKTGKKEIRDIKYRREHRKGRR